MSQPNTSYPPATVQSAPPADDGSHIHRERRAILLLLRTVTYVFYGLIVAIEIILALGFILLLLGANPGSSFVDWWYRNLDRVMEPFRGIFTPIELGATKGNEVPSIFETSVLFAMVIYAIAAVVVYALATWLGQRIQRLDVDDRAYHERMAYERQAYLDRLSAERIASASAANQEAIARGVAAGTAQQPAPPQPGTPPPPPPG